MIEQVFNRKIKQITVENFKFFRKDSVVEWCKCSAESGKDFSIFVNKCLVSQNAPLPRGFLIEKGALIEVFNATLTLNIEEI